MLGEINRLLIIGHEVEQVESIKTFFMWFYFYLKVTVACQKNVTPWNLFLLRSLTAPDCAMHFFASERKEIQSRLQFITCIWPILFIRDIFKCDVSHLKEIGHRAVFWLNPDNLKTQLREVLQISIKAFYNLPSNLLPHSTQHFLLSFFFVVVVDCF